ncbi:MAG: hypothetical protein E3K37_18275 [Candidatus Kuenenia sp.]|nr:hypothetical protein [Candidatus Kuenenia hertensis]
MDSRDALQCVSTLFLYKIACLQVGRSSQKMLQQAQHMVWEQDNYRGF